MGLSVIHHAGTKEGLLELLQTERGQIKKQVKDSLEEDELQVVDQLGEGDFSNELAPFVLMTAIKENFKPVSMDYRVAGYQLMARETNIGELGQMASLFYEGRNFETGEAGFEYDGYASGYLTPEEAREFMQALRRHDITDQQMGDFMKDLTSAFESITDQKTGDLFIVL